MIRTLVPLLVDFSENFLYNIITTKQQYEGLWIIIDYLTGEKAVAQHVLEEAPEQEFYCKKDLSGVLL